jgi:hypothetical protein
VIPRRVSVLHWRTADGHARYFQAGLRTNLARVRLDPVNVVRHVSVHAVFVGASAP